MLCEGKPWVSCSQSTPRTCLTETWFCFYEHYHIVFNSSYKSVGYSQWSGSPKYGLLARSALFLLMGMLVLGVLVIDASFVALLRLQSGMVAISLDVYANLLVREMLQLKMRYIGLAEMLLGSAGRARSKCGRRNARASLEVMDQLDFEGRYEHF